MNIRNIVFSEISQEKRTTCYMILSSDNLEKEILEGQKVGAEELGEGWEEGVGCTGQRVIFGHKKRSQWWLWIHSHIHLLKLIKVYL